MKKITKKMVTAGVAATMVASIGIAANAEEATYKVGVCQLIQHEALDAATQGFQDALTEKLGDRVTFDVQNASGESVNCSTIINGFVSDQVDLILANATGALQAAVAGTSDIPILGTAVTDYATALDIDDWTGTVGGNVSGTSDCAPLEDQAAMILELVPDAKTVGMLYCSAEPNSEYQINAVTEALKKLNPDLEITNYTFADSNDISSVATSASESDVIYIPTDNTAANNTEAINNVLEPAGVPVITGEAGICEGCGIATLSISYYDLGYTTGEMAYEILEEGADISTMAVQYAPNVTKQYMADRCEKLGITVPDDYEAIEAE